MLVNGTIPANPDTHQISSKSTTTQEWGPWSNPSPWRPGAAYTSGPRYCEKFNFSTPGVKTAITISLRLGIDSAYGAKLYLADNGDISPNNLETMALASATIADTREEQSFAFENISISGDYYIYVYAVSDTDSTAFYIPNGSTAATSYETGSKIEATCTLRGTRPNTDVRADVIADILPTVGTYNPFTFQSAVFHWRLENDGPYVSVPLTIAADGKRATAIIPSGTFSVGNIQWYVSGEDNGGGSPVTEIQSFSSYNRFCRIEAISPQDGFFGNNEPITFSWQCPTHTITERRQFDLQYSYNGSSWTNLVSVPVTEYGGGSYIAPANTFLPGTVYWRARAIAENGGVGEWSNVLTFEALGASAVTNLAASAVPFSTVSWEVTGELAYRIMIDNALFGPYRDPNAMSYTLAEPLSDGEHTIKVQAQNKYGLWSAWAETTVAIANVPGTAVVITGEATANGAELTITGGEQTGLFLVYRDAVHTARTPARLYKDRTALGRHGYYVIQAIADGYYTKSNTVEVVSVVECPEIALLSGGDFLTFGYSDSAYPEINVTRKTNAVKTHYSGAKFPTVETGDQEELSVSFGAFWLASDSDAADRLEAMQGKAVILKYPPDHVLVGVLDSLPGVDFGWKRAYTIYLEQMEWRDFTDES